MKIVANLQFYGECREAFEFYERALGGKIKSIVHFRDVPEERKLGPSFQNKVMMVWLDVGEQAIMGGDAPVEGSRDVQGLSISLHFRSETEAKEKFDALSEGGKVTMPFGQTPWSPAFGMLTDRFGTPWIINTQNG